MNEPEAAVYLDPFVESMSTILDALGDEGLTEMEKVWCEEYERVRQEQIAAFIRRIVEESGRNYEDIALAIGAKGRSFVPGAMKGHISLDKYLRLVDFFARETTFPPREERFRPATLKAMTFVRTHVTQQIPSPINREAYEFVRRATRRKDWWRARDAQNTVLLESIADELWAEVVPIVGNCEIRGLTELENAIDEWSPAYLVCVCQLSELE